MNVGEAILNFNRFDLLFLLFLFGMFVLGFMQGTIRRLLGLGSMAFSFLFAANLTNVVGPFLADNWNQFPDEYAVMLGFLIVFVAANDRVLADHPGLLPPASRCSRSTRSSTRSSAASSASSRARSSWAA